MEKKLFPYLMILPCMVVLILISIYPFIYSLNVSLTDYNLLRPPPAYVGLENYVELVADDARFRYAFGFTFKFAFLATVIEMLFGFGLAYLLNSRYLAPLTRNLFRILLTIPLVIPPVVAAFTWKTLIFDPTLGMLNYVLGLFTDVTVDFINNPRLTLVGLLLVEVTLRTSFVLIILFAGFQSLPLPLYEAAAIDGASAWHELIYITIPLLRPLLIIVFVFRLMDAFKVFDIIFVLTRGGPGFLTENIAIFSVNHTFDFLNVAYAAAGTILLLVSVMVLFTILLNATRMAK